MRGSATDVIAIMVNMGRQREDAHFKVVEYGAEKSIDVSECNLELIYDDDYFEKVNAQYTQFFTNMLFKKSYSMTTLAKLSGIDASTLYKLFHNQRKWNVEYIKRVCNAFAVEYRMFEYELQTEKKTVTQLSIELAECYRTLKTCGKQRYNQICQAYDISVASLKRYLRIAETDNALYEYIDSGRISLLAAVELSYLKPESQNIIAVFMNNNDDCILRRSHAVKLRKLDSKKKKAVTINNILKIMEKEN